MYHPRDDTLVITPWPIYYLQIKTIPNNTEVLHISCSCCCVYRSTPNIASSLPLVIQLHVSLKRFIITTISKMFTALNSWAFAFPYESISFLILCQIIQTQIERSLTICSVRKMTYTKTFAIKFRVYVTAHLPLNIDR